MKPLRLALLGAVAAAPAVAQPVQFSALATSEMGYEVNPFLAPGVTEGTAFAAVTIEPRLFYQAARSNTELQGRYQRETYLHDFGYTDAGRIGLVRTDQLTQYLTTTLTATYETTNRATIFDPSQPPPDPLDIGRRIKTLIGTYQAQWQATARDKFSYGVQASHTNYGTGRKQGVLGTIPSSYSQYAANAGYERVLDARTSVGAQVSVSEVRSSVYPDSRVIQPSLTAKRQFSVVWAFDGHIGVVFQHVDGPFPSSTTSLGLGANLCATYPRTHLCFQVSRDTSPSGYGPLRTASRIGIQLKHDFTEHSHVTADAQYLKDSSGAFQLVGVPVQNQRLRNSKAFIASLDYDRDLTQRISAGFGGRYESRQLITFSNARSYSGSIHVKAKLGRM